MKAVQYNHFGGPEVLEIVEVPAPQAGPGQVRIRVHAVGISATDPKLRSGALNFGHHPPLGTGTDIAGVVDQIGEGVSDVTIGDRVFGISPVASGAAEHALIAFYASIPASLGFIDAAALPAALETATRALNQLHVNEGSTVFLNGASGGIGSTAVQLAIARGARVIGAASAANQNYLRQLGTDPVVYGEGMIDRVRALAPDGVDAALDVVGNGVLPELITLAGSPEHVITLADFAGAKEHDVHFSNGFQDGPAYHALHTVGDLIETGRFWLPVDKIFPLERIGDAHRLSETGRVRGRLVLVV